MLNLNHIYNPITSRPFLANDTYTEYLPCDDLKPFIACYWGTAKPQSYAYEETKSTIVVPDACMDMIVEVNHTANCFRCRFVAIQDAPFVADREILQDTISRFAIRFNFWGFYFFTDLNMCETAACILDADSHFRDWFDVFDQFFYIRDMDGRIRIIEEFLLKKISVDRMNTNVQNAIAYILETRGSCSVKEACAYTCVSQRQLERLFLRHVGISIKKISGIVRYQNVWREIAFEKDFNIQDAVGKYGYTDDSHLLNSFKKYHGMYPQQAKLLADQNR